MGLLSSTNEISGDLKTARRPPRSEVREQTQESDEVLRRYVSLEISARSRGETARNLTDLCNSNIAARKKLAQLFQGQGNFLVLTKDNQVGEAFLEAFANLWSKSDVQEPKRIGQLTEVVFSQRFARLIDRSGNRDSIAQANILRNVSALSEVQLERVIRALQPRGADSVSGEALFLVMQSNYRVSQYNLGERASAIGSDSSMLAKNLGFAAKSESFRTLDSSRRDKIIAHLQLLARRDDAQGAEALAKLVSLESFAITGQTNMFNHPAAFNPLSPDAALDRFMTGSAEIRSNLLAEYGKSNLEVLKAKAVFERRARVPR